LWKQFLYFIFVVKIKDDNEYCVGEVVKTKFTNLESHTIWIDARIRRLYEDSDILYFTIFVAHFENKKHFIFYNFCRTF
jgi:hypothetical protein